MFEHKPLVTLKGGGGGFVIVEGRCWSARLVHDYLEKWMTLLGLQ